MAYTEHGHHIPGTNRGEGITKANNVARCGGTSMCVSCIKDAETYHLRFMGTPTNYPAIAMKMVKEHVDKRYSDGELPVYEVYLEAFTFVLGAWKGWFSTTLDDGLTYYIVYNPTERETYFHEQRTLARITIPD